MSKKDIFMSLLILFIVNAGFGGIYFAMNNHKIVPVQVNFQANGDCVAVNLVDSTMAEKKTSIQLRNLSNADTNCLTIDFIYGDQLKDFSASIDELAAGFLVEELIIDSKDILSLVNDANLNGCIDIYDLVNYEFPEMAGIAAGKSKNMEITVIPSEYHLNEYDLNLIINFKLEKKVHLVGINN
ncbi:MAG: hypothetical protein NTV30_05590 [Chloroflexi bacterium]|nr:hypothetical protein [Chloroflexota bacterium]